MQFSQPKSSQLAWSQPQCLACQCIVTWQQLLRFGPLLEQVRHIAMLHYVLNACAANACCEGDFLAWSANSPGLLRLLCCTCRWAFSIWGVIFALQGAGAIYAALPMGYRSPAKRAAVNTIGTQLATSAIAMPTAA